MRTNPGPVQTFFFYAATMLFYIVYGITILTKSLYFPKIYNVHHCMAQLQVATVSPASLVCSSTMLVLLVTEN